MRALPRAVSALACVAVVAAVVSVSAQLQDQLKSSDICAVPKTRLVFTLSDLSKYGCGGANETADARCSDICWCREWPETVTSNDTLVLCVPVLKDETCAGARRTDCRDHNKKLTAPSPQGTTVTTVSPPDASNKEADTTAESSGVKAWVYVVIAVVVVAIAGIAFFVHNWYKHRPTLIQAPRTSSIHRPSAPPPTWTELDSFEKEMPDGSRFSRPGNEPRSSLHSSTRSSVHSGSHPIPTNESIISGVSGTSYHDMHGTALGHMSARHAITETELSLSKDATQPVFSPISSASDDSRSVHSSDVSSGSDLGRRPAPPSTDSSFLSIPSTTYLGNNDTFSSQLTIPESDDGLSDPRYRSTTRQKEVEF
ncbi:hypothetical protein ATCC90586_003862 [Pythium insidiosum]|nr:hypothetical protein ATCC90586_003862 [Pythium insidiosum]